MAAICFVVKLIQDKFFEIYKFDEILTFSFLCPCVCGAMRLSEKFTVWADEIRLVIAE